MMKMLVVFMAIASLFSLPVTAQVRDSLTRTGLSEISQVNQGNSYVTFPADIGNIEPLWFEANIIPNFYIRQSKNSRLIGVLTPQIMLRMYQEESFPVRTPGYLPQLTMYYLLKEKEYAGQLSIFGRFAHHSNGQDGSFFDDDGRINLESGNFSTNFLEFGFIATNINTRLNAVQFFKSSFEFHPQAWNVGELNGLYHNYRWHNALSIFKLPVKNRIYPRKNADISLKGEATWMFGNPDSREGYPFDRLNLRLTFYYHPAFLEDIGLFVQYYHGSDYYNIYFENRLDVLRFGLMTEKLRF